MRYKALNKCKWYVTIHRENGANNGYLFVCNTDDDYGLSGYGFKSWSFYKTTESAKAGWELFAKRNGFKNWKFV